MVVPAYWMVERLITAKAEGKKAMRATCKADITAITGIDDNCPILLEKMTFSILSHYMSMKKVRTWDCIYLTPDI